MKLDFRLDKYDALLIITIFIFISMFIVPSLEAGYHNIRRSLLAFIMEMIFAVPVMLLNVKVLMPYFFVKKRVWFYFPVLVLIIAPLLYPYNELTKIFYYNEPEILKEHGFRFGRIGIFIWMQLRHVTVMSLVLIIRRLVFARESIEELEKEKKLYELDLLKSQLNPHFYFNTLNNLYALALSKSEKTPECILQLSKLMEYVIYDCKNNLVKLSKELDFIKNYIALEKLRYESDVKINLKYIENSQIDNTSDNIINNKEFYIIPMILIQFVENAFKHGLSKNPDAFVDINIEINDDKLNFEISNSFDDINQEKSGIGLENTRRRLDLYYPNKYKLEINQNSNIYNVKLQIENAKKV
jgi:two-component system LytT family sensor kinase